MNHNIKVKNMVGHGGREIPNQFIITVDEGEQSSSEYFQSYDTIIAVKHFEDDWHKTVVLDTESWPTLQLLVNTATYFSAKLKKKLKLRLKVVSTS